MVSPNEIIIEKYPRLGFSATNNEAEYKALLIGVSKVKKKGEKFVKVLSDSRLVIRQVIGE